MRFDERRILYFGSFLKRLLDQDADYTISRGSEDRRRIENLVLDHQSMMCVCVYVCVCMWVSPVISCIHIYILNLYTYIYIRVLLYFLILEEFHFSLFHLGS